MAPDEQQFLDRLEISAKRLRSVLSSYTRILPSRRSQRIRMYAAVSTVVPKIGTLLVFKIRLVWAAYRRAISGGRMTLVRFQTYQRRQNRPIAMRKPPMR
jgi:hypothetical protein